jgi:hypothetical protein
MANPTPKLLTIKDKEPLLKLLIKEVLCRMGVVPLLIRHPNCCSGPLLAMAQTLAPNSIDDLAICHCWPEIKRAHFGTGGVKYNK